MAETGPFTRLRQLPGRLYVPRGTGARKKHPCPDCLECQWCADARCTLCRRGEKTPRPRSDQATNQ